MLDDLKTLVEFASKQADKIFRKTGRLQPMYHAVKSNGQHIVLPMPHEDKDVGVAMVKVWLALEDVDRYVFMNEGWILDRLHGPDITPEEMKRITRHGLSNHPDRREVLLFMAEDRRGNLLSARQFILRPEHGKASLSSLAIDDMTNVESKGRMVGLLNWEKKK